LVKIHGEHTRCIPDASLRALDARMFCEVNGHTRDMKAWQDLFGQFIEMNDHDWSAADDRLAKDSPPEKIIGDFVSFTRFVRSNFIDFR
jgi:hypothetical protein